MPSIALHFLLIHVLSSLGLFWYLSWKRIRLNCRRPWFDFWVGKNCWRRDRLPPPVFFGFPCGSAGKESACNAGDLSSILGLGRSPREGNGYPLQYPGLEDPTDSIVHGVEKSRTWLSDFHFHFSYFNHPNYTQVYILLSSFERWQSWGSKKWFTQSHTVSKV